MGSVLRRGGDRGSRRPLPRGDRGMRLLPRLVGFLALGGLLAACSGEAALPGQVVATIGPGAALATVVPTTGTADGSPGPSVGLVETTRAPVAVTAAPATPAETPTPMPTPTVKPYTGKVNLAGKVASDIPGTPVAAGTTVTSVADSNTKPRDVYAIEMEAGATLHLEVALLSQPSRATITVANPGSTSFDNGEISELGKLQAWVDYYARDPDTGDFSAAVTGVYYVCLVPDRGGVKYSMRFTVR